MNRTDMPILRILLALLLLFPLGCRQEDEAPVRQPQGEVRASPAYISYFGQPPTVKEGSCFAYVGFYPPAGDPGKVRPFPLFLFNREDHPQVIVEQLLRWGEDWDLGGLFGDPVPEGTELLSLEREEADMIRVELSAEVLEEADREAQRLIAGLLGHSLAQFEGIDRVMVVAGGTLLPGQAERGFVPDPDLLAEPGPPVPISATAVWEADKTDPEEVSVFFDRPVRIETFKLTDREGKEIEGKYYRSVFDMAVVVHPARPREIREGMPVHLVWEGEDFLDRRAEGSRDFILQRVEHP